MTLLTGCRSPSITAPEEFTVHVDSISGFTAASGGIPYEARLWGTVGPGGCTAFKALRTVRVPAQLDVTVIGERTGESCTPKVVPLDGIVLRADPIIPYDFRIVVHQEDGSLLVRRIYGE